MKIKLLFQGDSITDANRDRSDYHDLGEGYPKYAAQGLREAFPDVEFEFIDLGIGGNKTADLVNRLQSDFVDIQPDVVSILIGINDVWHFADEKNWIPNEVFEQRYRTVLEAVKTQTRAKILMLEPFLIPVADKQVFWEDLPGKMNVIRKLAREYADGYLALDGRLNEAFIGTEPTAFASDGVHPTERGARYIADLYVQAVTPLIEQVLQGKEG